MCILCFVPKWFMPTWNKSVIFMSWQMFSNSISPTPIFQVCFQLPCVLSTYMLHRLLSYEVKSKGIYSFSFLNVPQAIRSLFPTHKGNKPGVSIVVYFSLISPIYDWLQAMYILPPLSIIALEYESVIYI